MEVKMAKAKKTELEAKLDKVTEDLAIYKSRSDNYERLHREQSDRLTELSREYNELQKVLEDHRNFMKILRAFLPPWTKAGF